MKHTPLNPITPRGVEINAASARPFEAIREARSLLRTTRLATIATIDPQSGYPYAMVTNIAIEPDGTPYFFVARLAIHARNIEADNRISLAFAEDGAADSLTRPRLTLVGRAYPMDAGAVPAAKERYAQRFPKAKLYLDLPDAVLYRVAVQALQINGGPAQNANEVTVAALMTNLSGAEDLMSRASDEIQRLNHSASELGQLVELVGGQPGNWRVSGLDPDGIELSTSRETRRHWFAQRVTNLNELAAQIKL